MSRKETFRKYTTIVLLFVLVSTGAAAASREACDEAQRAADKGSAIAKIRLASCFSSGSGRSQDYVKAEEILRDAIATAPDRDLELAAIHTLSVILLFEQPDDSRYQEGLALVKEGLGDSSVGAYVAMGVAKLIGRGVTANSSEAVGYLEVAAHARDVTANLLLYGVFLTGSHDIAAESHLADMYWRVAEELMLFFGESYACEKVDRLRGDWLFDGLVFDNTELEAIISDAGARLTCCR
jgi:TPR repeat protein